MYTALELPPFVQDLRFPEDCCSSTWLKQKRGKTDNHGGLINFLFVSVIIIRQITPSLTKHWSDMSDVPGMLPV